MPPRLISDRMLDLFPQQRSPGHHVSSALHTIMETLYPDRFGSDTPPDQTRLNLGNALERAIVDAIARDYPDHFVRPGELWEDGLLGTPDLWYLGGDKGDPIVAEYGRERATVEIKLTWASSRRAEDIEDEWFWRYWQQLRAYSYMAKMARGLLIIVFIVGNWRDKTTPVAMMWEDRWTQEDLQETWDMIKAYTSHETGSRSSKVEDRVASLASPNRLRRGTGSSAGTRSSTSGGRKRGRSGR